MRLILTLSLLLLFFCSHAQKNKSTNIAGFYSSKRAELGFFVTKIQLNKDSTFKYEFSGDLSYNKGTGKYKVEENLIQLEFNQVKTDSTNWIREVLTGGSTAKQSIKFFFKRDKLYEFHLITKQVITKNYLKKRRGQKLIFRGEK